MFWNTRFAFKRYISKTRFSDMNAYSLSYWEIEMRIAWAQELMASVPSQREGRGVEWVTKRVFVVLGGLFAFVFFFLPWAKYCLPLKYVSLVLDRKLAKLESACLVWMWTWAQLSRTSILKASKDWDVFGTHPKSQHLGIEQADFCELEANLKMVRQRPCLSNKASKL